MSKLSYIITLIVICSNVFAQESDARLRTAIAFSKKINDFKFSFTEEYRRDENFGQTDKSFTQLSADYELVKNVEAGISYRFNQVRNHEYGGYDFDQRLCFNLAYEHKIEDITLSVRTRYQIAREYDEFETVSRNKFGVSYKISKNFKPSFSYETYFQFNQLNQFSRNRIELSNRIKIYKRQSIKFGYLYENRFNRKIPQRNHIYFINYNIKL